MKKVVLLLFVFIIKFCSTGFGQKAVIKVYEQQINTTSLKITDHKVFFTSAQNSRETSLLKGEIKWIDFGNGIKINYELTEALEIQSSLYNATINLIDGSFFTAFVDSITADSVYYHKFNVPGNFSTGNHRILFISYINRIRESFVSTESVKASKKITNVQATENRINRASFTGLTVGLSNAWLEGEGYIGDRKGRNGILIGLNYEYQFSKRGGLNLGVRYEQKGSLYQNDSLKTHYNFPYLTIPFSYRAYLGNNKLNFYFDAGFYFGFLLAAHIEIENSKTNPSQTLNLNQNQYNIHHLDFGPSIGIGFNFKKLPKLFSAGIQYSPGLITVQSGNYYSYPDYYSFATLNRNVVFYVTFGFDFKGWKQHQQRVKSIK